MISAMRRAARQAIVASARDATTAAASRPALVLAPHPDDETLGCGATILRKLAAGATVTVAVMTDGSRSHRSPTVSPAELAATRRAEMTEAGHRLGLADDAVRWGGFPDGELNTREDELNELIAALISEVQPTEVYATSALEPHPDHAALGRAARRAVREASGVTLLEYPVWLWGTWPLQAGHRLESLLDAAGLVLGRRARRVRCEPFGSAKLHALDAHSTQLRRPAGVPEDEPWPVLPAHVMEAASAAHELFIPWPP